VAVDVERVRAWLAEDPDPATRREVEVLLERGDQDGLNELFEQPLGFGTAGIRGALGAGPARFNTAVVRRTSAGLARYLREGLSPAAAAKELLLPPAWRGAVPAPSRESALVVVGHDARHGSARFAWDASRVLASAGLRALHFDSALPTPILAFAVKYFHADAGVMVTASHNPASDNGYKVYLSDGAQVLPPHDAAIAEAAQVSGVPQDLGIAGPFGGRLSQVDEAEVLGAYVTCMKELLRPEGPRRLRAVYSPLHGVGGAVLPRLFEEAGFERPLLVAQQASPDPDFPTAPFPNPEEPGVMGSALELGLRAGADVVLVNDPDADRLAVAARLETGELQVLSGDELGVLAADHLIYSGQGPGRLVATTVVSSTMLRKLAARAGVGYAGTLTGFKWVARAARLVPGCRLVFGYEEALGYAVSSAVADKDGLSAALVVAEMAAIAKAEGRTVFSRLDELQSGLGVHLTSQWSLRTPGHGPGGQGALAGVMARWRSSPPSRLGGLEVARVRDISQGEGDLPPADVVVLELVGATGQGLREDGSGGLGATGRVVLRPSGTEPKLKVYFEVAGAPCDSRDVAEARREAEGRMRRLREAVEAQVRAQVAGG
jgi:phosphomannomutase